jgi:4-hydroxyproline epimerase
MAIIHVVDSHTGGEPTRTIVDGGPDLGTGAIAQRLDRMRTEFDHYRRAIVNEPRGSDVMVGAMLVPAADPNNHSGIIFFNNIGYLGMCGHGTIGVVETLRYLDKIDVGSHQFETSVGTVRATLDGDGLVTIENVPSYREAKSISLDVSGIGTLVADIAYGGNWFCLVHCPDEHWLDLPIAKLLDMTQRILAACRVQFPQVDHVELFATPRNAKHSSRNFVLCPGGAYDRSPCGTGTSAKLACLAADEELDEGALWYQESIIGSLFAARYRWLDRRDRTIVPYIAATAHVNSDCRIIIDDRDPFAWGLRNM